MSVFLGFCPEMKQTQFCYFFSSFMAIFTPKKSTLNVKLRSLLLSLLLFIMAYLPHSSWTPTVAPPTVQMFALFMRAGPGEAGHWKVLQLCDFWARPPQLQGLQRAQRQSLSLIGHVLGYSRDWWELGHLEVGGGEDAVIDSKDEVRSEGRVEQIKILRGEGAKKYWFVVFSKTNRSLGVSSTRGWFITHQWNVKNMLFWLMMHCGNSM